MGAVAVALQERGFKVTGSDANVYPPMSSFLETKGIALMEGYRAENIPADADVVVIGNAMRRGNPEVEAVHFICRCQRCSGISFCAAAIISLSPERTVKRRPRPCLPG